MAETLSTLPEQIEGENLQRVLIEHRGSAPSGIGALDCNSFYSLRVEQRLTGRQRKEGLCVASETTTPQTNQAGETIGLLFL